MQTNEEAVIEQAVSPAHNVSEAVETDQDRNWKAQRERLAIERKEKQEAQRKAEEKAAETEALKAALDAVLNKPQQRHQNEPDDVDEEEERIQRKVDKAIQDREKQYQQQQQQRENQEFPQRLRQVHKDFDTVCSQENIDYLEYHHPEIAEAFNYMPDGFNKWSKAYLAIKKLIPHTGNDEKKKMTANLNKPQSMAVSGVTQVGDNAPIQLDDKRRAENYKRMLRVMKGA